MSVTIDQQADEMDRNWRKFGIAGEFWRIHHFIASGYSGKREPLASFVGYCRKSNINEQNRQTLRARKMLFDG